MSICLTFFLQSQIIFCLESGNPVIECYVLLLIDWNTFFCVCVCGVCVCMQRCVWMEHFTSTCSHQKEVVTASHSTSTLISTVMLNSSFSLRRSSSLLNCSFLLLFRGQALQCCVFLWQWCLVFWLTSNSWQNQETLVNLVCWMWQNEKSAEPNMTDFGWVQSTCQKTEWGWGSWEGANPSSPKMGSTVKFPQSGREC